MAFVNWMDNLPLWAKIILALPGLDIIWAIYRIVMIKSKTPPPRAEAFSIFHCTTDCPFAVPFGHGAAPRDGARSRSRLLPFDPLNRPLCGSPFMLCLILQYR